MQRKTTTIKHVHVWEPHQRFRETEVLVINQFDPRAHCVPAAKLKQGLDRKPTRVFFFRGVSNTGCQTNSGGRERGREKNKKNIALQFTLPKVARLEL